MSHENDFMGKDSCSDNNERKPATPSADSSGDFIAELKRRLEKNRLPAAIKEQILASLPPLEEQERLYRQLCEKGGLSSEEFLASLGLNGERQP
jgi:hypothetical protein